jgi:hypothetical protein
MDFQVVRGLARHLAGDVAAAAALAAKGEIQDPGCWLSSFGRLEHLGNLLGQMAKALRLENR